jgi:hypothetical protein
MVEVSKLISPQMVVEIEADAVVEGKDAYPNWCGPNSQ